MSLTEKIQSGEVRIAVLGMGYVGLPIALEFSRELPVVGYDINNEKIKRLKEGHDPSGELEDEAFSGTQVHYTSDIEDIQKCNVYIVAVPTPIDESNIPDLSPLISATRAVGKVLSKGDYVVYESTVYPGATEEDCIPLLEEQSGLTYKEDFKVGYSPERINPGDKVNTLRTIKKVVSGCDEESLRFISALYSIVVDAGVYEASSIKVAEAAKIIENTQRDVNIALMNELSMIFDRMGINTYEVLEAAGTKWNFLNFFPGLVGGHCIGVDPYYLTFKAEKLRYYPKVILSGRDVNDSMGFYIARQLVKKIIQQGKNVLNSRVLILGVTFKENVGDIRNSRVPDIRTELESYGIKVDVMDPYASPEEVMDEYEISLRDDFGENYDAFVVAVAHDEFKLLNEKDFIKMSGANSVLVDVKGIYRGKISQMIYWSL